MRLGSKNDSGEFVKWAFMMRNTYAERYWWEYYMVMLVWFCSDGGEVGMVSRMISLSFVLCRIHDLLFVHRTIYLKYRGVRRFALVTSSIFSLPFVPPGDQDHGYRIEITSSRLGIQISRQKGVLSPQRVPFSGFPLFCLPLNTRFFELSLPNF